MKYLKNLIYILAILLICTGCPYKSLVPISAHGDLVNQDLLGKWKKAEEEEVYYIIEKSSDRKYKIVENAYNPEEDAFEITLYEGTLNNLDGEIFLCVFNSSAEEDEEYYLHKIEITDKDNFVLFPLSNYIREEFETSEALQEFILKNKHLSFFFGTEEGFVRSEM
ncbi:hypothetical protein [Flexithrix dorotheae]|uniref:hypothetical protein n=1 Tax=Flexithrix dorotheae TaxID=70993 RepID=UPI00035D4BFD|nr:hypothetical protein [Flexithrix dorotheae]